MLKVRFSDQYGFDIEKRYTIKRWKYWGLKTPYWLKSEWFEDRKLDWMQRIGLDADQEW